LSSVSVKKLTEKKIKNSLNEEENKVQITFNALKNDVNISKTITMTGKGSVKVLIPA